MKLFTKKKKALKKWHSRAMIINVKKTRITFIKSYELSDIEETSNDAPQMLSGGILESHSLMGENIESVYEFP